MTREQKLPNPTLEGPEWKPETKLDGLKARALSSIEASGRRLGIEIDLLKTPETIVPILGVAAIAAGTMSYELHALGGDLSFGINYIKHNLLPSIIWTGPPSDLIAMASQAGPEVLKKIQELNPDTIRGLLPRFQEGASDAYLAFTASQYLRWTTTGALFLGQLVNVLNLGQEANKFLTSQILAGKEPMFRWEQKLQNRREKIARLAGVQSDVTEFDMDLNPHHFLPIVEDIGAAEYLIETYTQGGKRPAVAHIPNRRYGEDESWENVHISPEWLLTAARNKKILLLEADASVGEQSFALGPESANDLELQEVAQAKRSLAGVAKRDKVTYDQLLAVMLADSQQIVGFGENGKPYTLRQQNDVLHDADIIIDARAPLIGAVLQWAEKVTKKGQKKIVFATTNDTYFETIKAALKPFGYKVVRWSPLDTNLRGLPHLVYQNITADTIQTTRDLIEQKLVDPSQCCPLIDRKSGQEAWNKLKTEFKQSKNMHAISSAQIYSELFRLVRFWLRLGFSPEQIQKQLDSQWQPFLSPKSKKNKSPLP